jgi:hypothetical protein
MFTMRIPPLKENASQALQGEALSAQVQAVSEELRVNLDRAETLSDGWSNAALAEMLVDVAVSCCLARLEATGCVGPANRVPSSRLWNLLGERLQHSWLVHRARLKPRGYAGDYELLEWICQERVGDHPFGRTLDRFFQKQAAPGAVRARTELVAGAIVGRIFDGPARPHHVVIVGAGPAADVRLAASLLPKETRSGLHATLLDLDPAALDFAGEKLAALLPAENIRIQQVNLMRLHERNAALPQAGLIACPGLFDYLDDRAAVEMLALLWRRVEPGGMLMVGNFAPGHPTRSYMEWVGNWYLVYRTAEDLHRLAQEAGIASEARRVTAERTGIDLFLIAEKP